MTSSPVTTAVPVLSETLRSWSLFGSAFFVVGAAPEGRGETNADRLLAINSRGLHLLDTVTHVSGASQPAALT